MYNPTLSLHSSPYLGRPVQRSVCEKQAHDEKHTKRVYIPVCVRWTKTCSLTHKHSIPHHLQFK